MAVNAGFSLPTICSTYSSSRFPTITQRQNGGEIRILTSSCVSACGWATGPYFVVLGVGKLLTLCGFSNGVGLELKSAASRSQKGEFVCFLGDNV